MVGRLGQDCQHRLRNAPFWLESKDESSLDDGLSIVYTEAEIRRPRPFIPSKFSDVLEAWFVPIISVKILLHILVKSRKKNNLPIEEKIWFLYFMRFLEVSINGKIESFIFLYQERQNASARKG